MVWSIHLKPTNLMPHPWPILGYNSINLVFGEWMKYQWKYIRIRKHYIVMTFLKSACLELVSISKLSFGICQINSLYTQFHSNVNFCLWYVLNTNLILWLHHHHFHLWCNHVMRTLGILVQIGSVQPSKSG